MSNALWKWSAVRMRDALAAREVSARELTQSCLDRIGEVNPDVNALVEVRADDSLALADHADARRRAGEQGALLGIPVATKINTELRGYATTEGVVAFADRVADQDAPIAKALRDSGAVFTGRSNSPAFGFRWFSSNDLHGRTLNPWDASRTPGGSSGGAGAAVASGMVPLAQGNDIGGSVRYPAYVNGVVGLRPTQGLGAFTSATGDVDRTLSFETMCVEGPLARSIADLRLTLDAFGQWDPRAFWQVPGNPTAAPSPHANRVGVVRDPGVIKPSAAVDAALTDAAYALEAAGFEVAEIEVPELAEVFRLWYLIVLQEFASGLPQMSGLADAGMNDATRGFLAAAAQWWGEKPTLDDFINGYSRRTTLGRKLQLTLEQYPTLLMPTSADQAMPQDYDVSGVENMIHAVDIQWPMMAIPLLGVPGLSVPTGVVNGLPVGVQLVGRRFDDRRLLDVGEIIEQRAGVFTPVDPR